LNPELTLIYKDHFLTLNKKSNLLPTQPKLVEIILASTHRREPKGLYKMGTTQQHIDTTTNLKYN